MPSTECRFADCRFRFVEDFEKRPSQALIKSFASMEDQANRPHRKAKVKKKHTGGIDSRNNIQGLPTDYL